MSSTITNTDGQQAQEVGGGAFHLLDARARTTLLPMAGDR